MFYRIARNIDKKFKLNRAKAHCDVPCGIYDPITAQIDALTVVRMIDLINLKSEDADKNPNFYNSITRYISVKEDHAESAKHEIRVIWGDFIKSEHLEIYPKMNGIVHQIMQLGSECRQTVDRDTGLSFVEAINQFAKIFWEIKGIATKRATAPYAPALELVYPDL